MGRGCASGAGQLLGEGIPRSSWEVLRDRFGVGADISELPEPVHPQPVASEDLYHALYEQFVVLQRGASSILSFVDRRVREQREHYESKLGWARYEADQIVEMNEWLVDQLELQSDRLRDLAVPDVPSTDWLTGRTAVPGSHGQGVVDVDADGEASVAEQLDGVDPDEDAEHDEDDENDEAAIVPRGEDDLRRDEGFDDPPGESVPLWMLDVHASH